MKTMKKYLLLLVVAVMAFTSCTKDKDPVANNVELQFKNTFGDTEIVLGGKTDAAATVNTSVAGQVHHFSELKYVISNIRLVKADNTEIPFNINNLDKGATVVNQAKAKTLSYILNNIPVGEYKQIKFGLGVSTELNTLDQEKFPEFYAAAGKNDTEMMWEWGTGYRFTKIEGFYGDDNKELSIHTGSTVADEAGTKQGVDAYRNIVLDLPQNAVVGRKAPKIIIKADFNKLLSGSTKITLKSGNGMQDNATPNIHTAVQMTKFVNNLGGDGEADLKGMFSIAKVEN